MSTVLQIRRRLSGGNRTVENGRRGDSLVMTASPRSSDQEQPAATHKSASFPRFNVGAGKAVKEKDKKRKTSKAVKEPSVLNE